MDGDGGGGTSTRSKGDNERCHCTSDNDVMAVADYDHHCEQPVSCALIQLLTAHWDGPRQQASIRQTAIVH